MLRTTKWKLEKAKVKVVFRLQFHATNIPQSGWEKLYISFIPTESGKIIAKTSKANVRNGTCKWADPIYETTRLLVDSRNKRYDDKLYKLVVGMGTSRASILGEATINLADYADASNPFVIALPLHESDHGTILHVTVQLLTAKTGFREFEQQFDKGLQSSSNLNREVEPSNATSSSELQISDDHRNKVNTKTHFGSESEELVSAVEGTSINEELSDSSIGRDGSSNASESYYADKIDSSSIHEPVSHTSMVKARSRSPPTEKADRSDHQGWSSDYSVDNDLVIANEENHRLKKSLEMAESSIFELKLELSALHSHANEMGTETQKIGERLMAEIFSGQKLEREIMVLRSECSKFRDELEQLKAIKSSSRFVTRTLDEADRHQVTWVNGLLVVEDQIREIQEKINVGFCGSNLSFIHSDLEVLLSTVQDLEKGAVIQETGSTRGFNLVEGKNLELLSQLDEAKAERENLIRKMDEMECYYEALVQELEENQKQIIGEFQRLRYEHSTCAYTISTCKAENESMRHDMNDQVLRFTKERHALGCVNEELEKRVMTAEALVQELEEYQERILGEFQSLRNEHSRCSRTISTCKAETELIRHDMNDQIIRFTKERHTLGCVNEELEERATTAEARVQELEENQERILGEFQSLRNEHSTCADTISTCKAETESIRHDMNDQVLRFTKERHTLGCVNEELEKRATTAEARVQDLEENQEWILGEFQSLRNEHSTCADTISTCIAETESIRPDISDEILKFAEERHTLGCVNEELEKRVLTAEAHVQELEENQERILREFQSLKNEHSTCADTISTCKAETESIRNDMIDQTLKFAEERHALGCVNKELEKRGATAEARVQELEENYKRILGEFQSFRNEHSTCADTISTCKAETESIRHDMNDQTLKFTKGRHTLGRVNEELEKRATTAESALKRARLNYSVAVTQLQKDLDMLSVQVLSMFETNQNLIKETFSESSKPVSQRYPNIVENLQKSDELCEMCCANLYLDVYSRTLEETLFEASTDANKMKEQINEYAQKLELANQTRNVLFGRLQTAVEDVHALNEQISQINDMQIQNRKLEASLESVSRENFLLMEKISECEALLIDYRVYKSKYEAALAEKHELENLLEVQGLDSGKLRKDLSIAKEELEGLKAGFLELEKSNKSMQKLLDFLREKFGNLLASCDKQFTEPFSFSNSLCQDTDFRDITCAILKLEEFHNDTCEKIKNLKKERDIARSEIDGTRTKFTRDMNDMATKIDLLNTLVEKLQLQLETVAKKFKSSLELKESNVQHTEGLLTYLASLELELHKVSSKDGNFVLEILGSDTMADEFGRSKLTISELNQEKQDFLMPENEETTVCEELDGKCHPLERTHLTDPMAIVEENRSVPKAGGWCPDLNMGPPLRIPTSFALERVSGDMCEELETEIVRVVLKAKLDEYYDEFIMLRDKCSELTNKLSEQVIKTEEFENRAKLKDSAHVACEKNEPEGHSESLRIAFMKERCETAVQELKQELSVSKRHGEDILFKLQDALDENESRKKSEASYLKKMEELSFKIVGLEAELQSIQAELECALLNLECCKEEKGKIVASMRECEEENLKIAFELSLFREQISLKEEEDAVNKERHVGVDGSMNVNAITTLTGEARAAQIIELEGMKNEKSILSMMSSGSSFQDLHTELLQLHKANEELGSMYPNFKDLPGEGNALERVLALEIELAEALTAKKKSSIQFQSSFLKQHSDEEAIFKSFRDINELIKDTLEIKSKYVNVETELKEMHERYSQLSLQFAEVEGERQKLMMTIKNVRSPRNPVHKNHSSLETHDE